MPVAHDAVSTMQLLQLELQTVEPVTQLAFVAKHRLPAPFGAATDSGGTEPAATAVFTKVKVGAEEAAPVAQYDAFCTEPDTWLL